MTDVSVNVDAPSQAFDTSAQDIPCPLCGYNLRGLIEPRCPECGYRFEWAILLDPTRRPHPYLFEHHPERNVRSFVHTYVAGLFPRRFWRALQPIQPVRGRRLALYYLIATGLLTLTIVALYAWPYAYHVRSEYQSRAFSRQVFKARANDPNVQDIIKRYGSVDAYFDQLPSPFTAWWVRKQASANARFDAQSARIVMLVLLWPWLTLATLMIFRASMRRAAVRAGHVVRCTLYACDWSLWLGTIAILLITTRFAEQWLPIFYPPAAVPILAATLFAVVTSYRLGNAYARYLKFDRPFLTVIAAQSIVVLLVAAGSVLALG